jgi:hypothetical protein
MSRFSGPGKRMGAGHEFIVITPRAICKFAGHKFRQYFGLDALAAARLTDFAVISIITSSMPLNFSALEPITATMTPVQPAIVAGQRE